MLQSWHGCQELADVLQFLGAGVGQVQAAGDNRDGSPEGSLRVLQCVEQSSVATSTQDHELVSTL
jgi:hypothetical protein